MHNPWKQRRFVNAKDIGKTVEHINGDRGVLTDVGAGKAKFRLQQCNGKPVRRAAYALTDLRNLRLTMPRAHEYLIYIPEEGHWPINGTFTNKADARRAYLEWAGRSRLPAGSVLVQKVETGR